MPFFRTTPLATPPPQRITPWPKPKVTHCPTCTKELHYHPCETNRNGNRGRVVATCDETEACHTIEWLRHTDGSSVRVELPPLSNLGPNTCANPNCHQKGRIAANCPDHKCKQCCQADGGCSGVASHAVKAPRPRPSSPSSRPSFFNSNCVSNLAAPP
ncbi:hypothetical protein NMY22_g20094 [Coprinellus aureogranulatus]|nr:hypothetical protein NMY22_g20094 [Coprinellus aureogranulatus]